MIVLLLVLAAATPTVPALVKDVLAQKRYQFCHDQHYPRTLEEEGFCQLGAPPAGICPAFHAACQAGVTAQQKSISTPFQWPKLAPWIVAGVAAALLVVLLFLLGRSLWEAFRKRKDVVPEPERALPPGTPPPVRAGPTPLESDAERLLARAAEAAAAGDFARAVAELHAALLRRLEASGVIAFHPSRTNGEYVRAAGRTHPALAEPLRAFVRDVEAVSFGAAPPGPELYRSLLGRLHSLMGAVVLLALLVSGCDQRPDWDGSPSGRSAVLELLQRAGKKPHDRLIGLDQLDHDAPDAVVLLPHAEMNEVGWTALRKFVIEGGRLVLAGLPAGQTPRWLGLKISLTTEDGPVTGDLKLVLPPSPHLELDDKLHDPYRPGYQRKGAPYTAARKSYDGKIVALADDRLFMNAALPFADNALAVVRLFEGVTRIDFVGEETGQVSPDPITSVTRGRMLPFLAQLGLVLVVFFLMRGVAFGRLRDPAEAPRRSFAEHTQALAQQYQLGRAAPHLAGPYAQYAAERLRQRLALPVGTALPALAEAVARRTDQPPARVLALLADANANPQLALETLRGLAALLDEMGGPGERRGLS